MVLERRIRPISIHKGSEVNLRQQIIQDRADQVSTSLSLPPDKAFLRLVHSLITGQSIHAFDTADLVDGGQDKQIDTITIEQDGDEATVYIIQSKSGDSFSSNELIQMRNGLEWIFRKPRVDLLTISNTPFRDRIVDYRSLQSGIGPANISVVVAFVTKGLTDTISAEFEQEKKAILDQFDNSTFSSFDLLIWGADECEWLPNGDQSR